MNVAGLNISDLPKDRHYCRRANKDNFWLDWTKNKNYYTSLQIKRRGSSVG